MKSRSEKLQTVGSPDSPSILNHYGFLVHTARLKRTVDWSDLFRELQEERQKEIQGELGL